MAGDFWYKPWGFVPCIRTKGQPLKPRLMTEMSSFFHRELCEKLYVVVIHSFGA